MLIKGYELELEPIKDSYSRKSVQLANRIIEALRKLGVISDDVEVSDERVQIRNLPASASWYIDGHHCHLSYSNMKRYIDNLQVIARLVEIEVQLVIDGKKELQQFIFDYQQNKDFEEERIKAREVLQVEENCMDMELIDKQFKMFSKKLHPDMEGGDIEEFKKINHAHKILRKELE